jgi:CBS domain-containing protein
LDADTPVPAALHAMRSIDARHLPVTDEERLVGMVSFDDLFCYLVVQLAELAAVVNAARKIPDPFAGRQP